MTLLTIPLIHNIVKDIKCKGFSIEISDDSGRPIMQIKQGKWKGRKWFLSPHMCKSEVVQTAFMAIMAYNEHELREALNTRKKLSLVLIMM